jgi:hypothetical protein
LKAIVTRMRQLAQTEPTSEHQQRRRVLALRDRAMILIVRAGALPRIDYQRLTRADVKVVRAGLELTLHRTRADGGLTKITLVRVKPMVLCPVDAWRAWVAAVPADRSTPAFPRLRDDSPRNEPVGPMDICITIKRSLHAVGVDPTQYTDESIAAV